MYTTPANTRECNTRPIVVGAQPSVTLPTTLSTNLYTEGELRIKNKRPAVKEALTLEDI